GIGGCKYGELGIRIVECRIEASGFERGDQRVEVTVGGSDVDDRTCACLTIVVIVIVVTTGAEQQRTAEHNDELKRADFLSHVLSPAGKICLKRGDYVSGRETPVRRM